MRRGLALAYLALLLAWPFPQAPFDDGGPAGGHFGTEDGPLTGERSVISAPTHRMSGPFRR
jgi:hypothetical protein